MSKLNYNDHLDDLMERLMSEDISEEDMTKTLKIAKAVTDIAKIKMDEKKLKVDQFNALKNAGFVPMDLADDLGKSLGLQKKLIDQ